MFAAVVATRLAVVAAIILVAAIVAVVVATRLAVIGGSEVISRHIAVFAATAVGTSAMVLQDIF